MLYFCCITVVEFTFPALDLFLPRWCSDILGGHHRFFLSSVILVQIMATVLARLSNPLHSTRAMIITCTLKVPFQP